METEKKYQAKPKGKKSKIELVHFDTLTKEEQKEDHTLWKGEKGTYVFENTGEIGVGKPVRKVYLNRTYMTGLFQTRRSSEYSGDLKTPDGRVYLVFKILAEGKVEVFRKMPKVA